MAVGEAGPAAKGELRSLLAAIVESSVDAIISKTLDGVITTWNTGAENIYGYPADEIIGHDISEIFPPERSDELPTILALLRRGKVIGSFETKRRRKDGTIIDVSVAISPIRDAAGVVVGAASVARDVSERNRANTARLATEKQLQQAQRMETVGQLAGGIAHDFNNLLSTMMGFTSFVAEATTQQPELHADVEQIQEAVQRAAELVKQLLLFSRQTPARPAEVDITAIIKDADDLLAASVREVDLRFQLGESLPLILADRAQLEQVVFNLAVNARDAMPHGGTLTISTAETELTDEDVLRQQDLRPGHYVELTVSDTGTGHGAEVAARIFEPFFTTKPTGKGTGLGWPPCAASSPKRAAPSSSTPSQAGAAPSGSSSRPSTPHPPARRTRACLPPSAETAKRSWSSMMSPASWRSPYGCSASMATPCTPPPAARKR